MKNENIYEMSEMSKILKTSKKIIVLRAIVLLLVITAFALIIIDLRKHDTINDMLEEVAATKTRVIDCGEKDGEFYILFSPLTKDEKGIRKYNIPQRYFWLFKEKLQKRGWQYEDYNAVNWRFTKTIDPEILGYYIQETLAHPLSPELRDQILEAAKNAAETQE